MVYCGQTVGWIKMKLSMQVRLGPHIVLDGDPAPPPPKGHSPKFSDHICCGQMAGWIKMPLGTEVGLNPGHIVLHGDPAHPLKIGTAPNFRPMCIVAKRSSVSATAEHLLLFDKNAGICLKRLITGYLPDEYLPIYLLFIGELVPCCYDFSH